jgi:class 3 adenylate cyclase/pimeloyl-ACP methyl ester carboxylesterase
VDPAPTQYVDRDGAQLAYQVVGNGSMSLVIHLEIVQHLDLCWTDPHVHRNFERVAGLGRAVIFQRRGFGLSDPVPYVPTLEQQAEDVLAVMDAAGMDHAHLFGTFSTCFPMAMVAAYAPERVSNLFLHVPWADGLPSHLDRPPGWSQDEAEGYREAHAGAYDQWGSGQTARLWSTTMDSPYNRRLMGLLERSSTTPPAAQAHGEWFSQIDMTDVFRAIQVPTRVIRQESDRIPDAVVRRVSGLIPAATYRSLPAAPAGSSLGEGYSEVIDDAEQVLLGGDAPSGGNRSLGSVLFTDIVGSTELLVTLGHERYRRLRDDHERQVHLAVEKAGGRLVKVLGDGTLSVFDGPGRCVRCADEIRREASALGLEIRAGIHTGEIERAGLDIVGLSVHIGARVSAKARPGEILVSQTVRDIVVGSGLDFADRGEHELKGVPGRWSLYALVANAQEARAVQIGSLVQTLTDRSALVAARRAPGTVRTLMRLGNFIQRRRAGHMRQPP